MKTPKNHIEEARRLELLESYSIMDTALEADYDNLTSLAAQICGTPISLVTLVDGRRQWFKSHHGLDVSETPKEYAFCAHAMIGPDRIFQVEDSREDERFRDNPLVDGEPHVIFYAGVPLTGEDGLPLGTLCVIDHKPGKLDEQQINALTILSEQVMNLLELRRKKMELEKANAELVRNNRELEKFAYLAAHDLKSPLNNISSLIDILQREYISNMDKSGKETVEMIKESTETLGELIKGLLEHSRSTELLKMGSTRIDLKDLTNKIAGLFSALGQPDITLQSNLKYIRTNRHALERILLNLFGNAVKYNDKERAQIVVKVTTTKSDYQISVADNGPGIPPQFQTKIFDLFARLANTDRFGRQGTGIGLATVKRTVEGLGGQMSVDSEMGIGSTFSFSLPKRK